MWQWLRTCRLSVGMFASNGGLFPHLAALLGKTNGNCCYASLYMSI